MYQVLLVDDEPLILEGLEHIIDWAEYGLEIVGKAQNAEEALHYIEHNQIHILVTDIRMPNKSGLELIEKTATINQNILYIILSGYNDFELLKKAALLGIENYLIKPVNKDELSSTLLRITDKLDYAHTHYEQQIHVNEAVNILRDNVLLRLVTGNISIHEFADKRSFLKLDMTYNNYYIAMINTIKNNLNPAIKTDPLLINFAIRNICNNTLDQEKDLKGYTFNDSDDDIVMLLMTNNNQAHLIEASLKKIIQNIYEFLKQDIFISLGSMTNNYDDIQISYRKAKELVKYSLVYSEKGMITVSEAENQNAYLEKDFFEDFQLLQKNLSNRDQMKIRENIENIFLRLSQMEFKNPSLFYNVTVEILYLIFHTTNVPNNKHYLQTMNGKDILIDILNSKTVNEIAESILKVIESIMDHNEKNKNSLAEEVVQYVNMYYYEQISLKSLSRRFHLNTVYLGQQFKKETGQLFTTYLNELRISKAKELLQNTQLKSKEVAFKVGYLNSDYFYKIFKKVTGIFPSEY